MAQSPPQIPFFRVAEMLINLVKGTGDRQKPTLQSSVTLNELQAWIGPCTNSLWIKGQMAQMFKQAFRVPGFLFPKPKLWLVIRGNKGTPRVPHSSQGYRWLKRVVEQVWLQTFQSYVPWCLSKKHKKDFFASHEFKKCFKNDDFWVKKTLKIWLVRAHVSIEDSCSCQSQERKKERRRRGPKFLVQLSGKKIDCRYEPRGNNNLSKVNFRGKNNFQNFVSILLRNFFDSVVHFFAQELKIFLKILITFNFTKHYTVLKYTISPRCIQH